MSEVSPGGLEEIAAVARKRFSIDIHVRRVEVRPSDQNGGVREYVLVKIDGREEPFANWMMASTAIDYYIRGHRAAQAKALPKAS